MERQAGLGKSLEQVLDSLTPAELESSAPGRVLYDPEDVEQQLDQLMGDIRDLRERVQHLVGMIPDPVVLDGAPTTKPKGDKKKSKHRKKEKGKKKKYRKQAGKGEHLAGRNGSASRKPH